MTTSETFGGFPPPPPPPANPGRHLRRSTDGRVAAGVCSGLGDYFGVDAVLFRVLFATAAFFGGAGILAYLLAWAAIPDAGTEHAPIDGLVGKLRRRHVPIWLIAVLGGLLLWGVSFSWWAPGPFLPVTGAIVLLVVFYTRRELQAKTDPAPVNLTKEREPTTDQPSWVREVRAWRDEARTAARERRRRSLPVRIGILVALAVAMGGLAVYDAVSAIELQLYFWTALAVVVVGLLVGLVTRRLPFGMTPLLVPAIIGAVAFAGSHATLHDGIGQHEWKPTSVPTAQYRLAFGQGILDLRSLPAQSTPHTIRITAGAGQVKIIAPKTLNLTVLANIHIGQLSVDGSGHDHGHGGIGVTRTVSPPARAAGAPITVDVHLADGNVTVLHL
jgi:phage shock protein PspC (stress-responsive transcriptional regulator)